MTRQQKTTHICEALQRAGLQTVHADVDKRDICYLDGSVISRDAKAEAVQIAYDEGVDMVVEGLILGSQHADKMERHFMVVPYPHPGRHANKTFAQRVLGSHVDLSSRLFDVPGSTLRTGVTLATQA